MQQTRRALKNGEHSLVLCWQYYEDCRNPPAGLKKKKTLSPWSNSRWDLCFMEPRFSTTKQAWKDDPSFSSSGIRQKLSLEPENWKLRISGGVKTGQCLCSVPRVLLEVCEQEGTQRALLWSMYSSLSTSPCCSSALSWSSSLMLSGFVGPLECEAIDSRKGNRDKQKLRFHIIIIWEISWKSLLYCRRSSRFGSGVLVFFVFVFYDKISFVAERRQSSKTCFMSLSLTKYLLKGRSVSSLVFKTVLKVQLSDWFSKWVARNQKIACPSFNLPAHLLWNEVFYNECSWLALFTFYLYFLRKIQGIFIAN